MPNSCDSLINVVFAMKIPIFILNKRNWTDQEKKNMVVDKFVNLSSMKVESNSMLSDIFGQF